MCSLNSFTVLYKEERGVKDGSLLWEPSKYIRKYFRRIWKLCTAVLDAAAKPSLKQGISDSSKQLNNHFNFKKRYKSFSENWDAVNRT